MRYQSRIYIQNAHGCVKNKDHLNLSMSSDICVFDQPKYTINEADKIKTPTYISDDNIHIITSQSSINLTFNFIENFEVFNDISATFKYKIYKYNNLNSTFSTIPLVESDDVAYADFMGTSAFTDTIAIADLNIDGEYLIKGSYDFTMCTEIMNSLGETIDTSLPLIGDSYGIYDSEFDDYFAVITKAPKPLFTLSPTDTRELGALVVESYILNGETEITTNVSWVGSPIVTLNGLTLAIDEDYTTAGNTVYLNGATIAGDILTIAFVNGGNPNGLLSESIIVDDPVVSGITDGEGSELIYFNTDIGKFEIYTLADPIAFNDIIVSLNGVTLANGLDYYQSTENPRRIVLNGQVYASGDLNDGNAGVLADIITITYNSYGTYVGEILTDEFPIYWTVTPAPVNNNGKFIILVAEDDTYTNILFSAETPYITNTSTYNTDIDLSTYTGTTAVYKVTNQKNYNLISGDVITTFTKSEEIPIEIII